MDLRRLCIPSALMPPFGWPYLYLYFKFSRVAVAQPLHLVVLRLSRVFLASNLAFVLIPPYLLMAVNGSTILWVMKHGFCNCFVPKRSASRVRARFTKGHHRCSVSTVFGFCAGRNIKGLFGGFSFRFSGIYLTRSDLL